MYVCTEQPINKKIYNMDWFSVWNTDIFQKPFNSANSQCIQEHCIT